jgi:hypothetical protein
VAFSIERTTGAAGLVDNAAQKISTTADSLSVAVDSFLRDVSAA